MYEKKMGIIVDAFSTGKYLAQGFLEKGIECIHVKSSPYLPGKYLHKSEEFNENLIYEGDPYDQEQLKSFIKTLTTLADRSNYQFLFCLSGSESGVELADSLSESLGLSTNGTTLSRARRDKYEMTKVVKKSGVKTIRQFISDDIEKILAWRSRKKIDSLVLKPRESASNDNVFFCHTAEEISIACAQILASSNVFGKVNTQVLAQPFNYGQEYIVDTVSWEGKHYISEILRIIKIPQTIIYDRAEIVHEDEKEFQILFEHTKRVLDALQIRYGAGTTEWKYTPDGGPVFLESASRLMGGAFVPFYEEMIGFSQLSLMVEAYSNPAVFLKRIMENKRPEMKNIYGEKKHGWGVVLISDSEGRLKKDLDVAVFKDNLVTLYGEPAIGAKKGDLIQKTNDYLTAPGEIHLIGSKRNEVWMDYLKIRNIERQGFYRSAIFEKEEETRKPFVGRLWDSKAQHQSTWSKRSSLPIYRQSRFYEAGQSLSNRKSDPASIKA